MNPNDPYSAIGVTPVINAAGKMTALGGTAQQAWVADAQAAAAQVHVDLAQLRAVAGRKIAAVTGADDACITTGAAAGIAIGIAAILTGTDPDKVRRIPDHPGPKDVLIQAGHDVDFGAAVTQMIRLGGGNPVVFGTADVVTDRDLDQALSATTVALVYVKSHHCIQERRLPLSAFLNRGLPVLVDAAAEEDLRAYIRAGADLVTYSGGKAIGGPTSGFIAGRRELIEACEMQQRGIGRAMKVGKEQIMGLLAALGRGEQDSSNIVMLLEQALSHFDKLDVSLADDRAGRDIRRVAIRARGFNINDLVDHLTAGNPSIRTRNHQLREGLVLFDPRELRPEHIPVIEHRVADFFRQAPTARA